MTDAALLELARAAGVAARWRDVHGQDHDVAIPTLRAVLRGIGVAADSDDDVRASLEHPRAPAALLTADINEALPLDGRWQAVRDDGERVEGRDPPKFAAAGYYRLECDGRAITVAVAPPRCADPPPGRRWGLAAQLYGLRRDGDGGVGDFAALADLARAAGRRGADALAISPVHAQFTADPRRFSPYAPSSRIMLNALHAAAPYGDARLEADALVDWPAAAAARMAQFRAEFARGGDGVALAAFRAERGDALRAHATFEALHAHFLGPNGKLWHWRDWPEAYRDPASADVAEFAAAHADDIAFHCWLQFHADRGLAGAQAAARGAGMRIGLIADLAVGADSGGSQAWSRQDEMLRGLSVGAPPDLLNTRGQDWRLTTFSPRGLQHSGFRDFIDMLRAALRHAGGVRIDHAMGLQRLWLVPEGASAADGAYVSYPLTDLLRLVRLESRRHAAIVVAEDLGTVAEGFQARLEEAGILGMRVLWFERDGEHFVAPRHWPKQAVAMTTTHDLPTVAGWWRGRDIEWRSRIGLVPDMVAAGAEREREREFLWRAFRASGAAETDSLPPEQTAAVATAACAHVASAACVLALLPIEDVLGLPEQPNLPGTLDEHPNWRRRLEGPASALLDPPGVATRIAAITAARISESG